MRTQLLTLKEYALSIGATYGSVKRWRFEGMPVIRMGSVVRVDPITATPWLATKPLKSVAFHRVSAVYFARGEDGLIKIGFTSDLQRREVELRKEFLNRASIVAWVRGTKRLELALHARFAAARVDPVGEWFHPVPDLEAIVECLEHG